MYFKSRIGLVLGCRLFLSEFKKQKNNNPYFIVVNPENNENYSGKI